MAKQRSSRSADKDQKRADKDPTQVSLLKRLDPSTVRGISGVLLFVFGILLSLSMVGMAGAVGAFLKRTLYAFAGVGFYLTPLVFFAWTWSLLSTRDSASGVRPVRMVGAGLLFLSALAILGIVTDGRAGFLGELIARPLAASLDTLASLVVLTGAFVIGVLLVFDTALLVGLFHRVRALFARKRDDEEEETLDGVDEALEQVGSSVSATVDTEDEEYADEDLEEVYEPVRPEPKRPLPEPAPRAQEPIFELPGEYTPPSLSLLEADKGKPNVGDTKLRANMIRKAFRDFSIPVEMDEITVGPTVTRYALKPAANVRLSKILNLQSNVELVLAASPIRIEAPIPGKSLVGIEVPNTAKATVGLSGLLAHPDFATAAKPLFVALGKDIDGTPRYANLAKMPHLLVAGTTGSGKSVMIHSLITSLLYRNSPAQLKLILVDPKRVELTLYDHIPHLLTPVITDPKRCITALKWATKEMDRRYDLLREHGAQSIEGYHTDVFAPAFEAYERALAKGVEADKPEALPYIVVVIDELADIMATYPRELEGAIVRLAQMSRAVGIHLVLSTQRPSVNVITGIIKANIPTRIALKVLSIVDSRTILDQGGAEKLLGYGDLLYLSSDSPKPMRIQSPFLSNAEVKKVVAHIKKHNSPTLDATIDFGGGSNETQIMAGGNSATALDLDAEEADGELDELYEEVRAYVQTECKASTSLIQRRFKVGYGRAARIMDQLEERGIIEPSDGTNKARRVVGCSGGASGE